ncbi:hypothetical protein IAI18_05315 [Acetobacteraceae bacterium H6797]|nr:hypothetical protein [Acetobacteraceae bacterium H6797]
METKAAARHSTRLLNRELTPLGTTGPDADIIMLCAEHAAVRERYNTEGGHIDCQDDPLWHEYERTLDAVSAARPRTLEGVLAKARAAKSEVTVFEGVELWDNTVAGRWAIDVVHDLLRLAGDAP